MNHDVVFSGLISTLIQIILMYFDLKVEIANGMKSIKYDII